MWILEFMSKIGGKAVGKEEKSSGNITVRIRGRSKLFAVLWICLQNDCTTREGWRPLRGPYVDLISSLNLHLKATAHLQTIQLVTTIQAENLPLGLQLPLLQCAVSWLLVNCKRFTCDQVKQHRPWWENQFYLLDGKSVCPPLTWT